MPRPRSRKALVPDPQLSEKASRAAQQARFEWMKQCSFTACLILLLGLLLPGELQAQKPTEIRKHQESFVSGGRKIRVETYLPAMRGRLPAVLVLHSAAGTLAGKGELVQFSKQLAGQGAVVFFVRYFDRTRTLVAGDRQIDELSPVWRDTINDAIDFAAAHPRVDPERIGIFGYSLGAYLAVAAASQDSRVDAVAEVAGGIFEGFAPAMNRMPPLLILHGSNDQRVKISRAKELAAVAKRLDASVQMKIYPGEGHRLSPAAMEDAAARSVAFFRKQLSLQASGR
jgi:dipeptidyl aminopeptidase/acylaminoacyl peptidase